MSYYFFGYFFIAVALFPVIFFLFTGVHKMNSEIIILLIISLLIAVLVGLLMIRTARLKLNKRLFAIRDGVIIEAMAIKHGRSFVFWKSERDFTVLLEFTGPDSKKYHHTIQSGSRSLHYALTLQSKTMGFYDKKSGFLLFPVEIGLRTNIKDDIVEMYFGTPYQR